MTRRRLPHLYVIGQPLFITFRLQESLPPHRAFPPAQVSFGEAFVAMDRILDQARCGPTFLKMSAIAEVVVTSIRYGAEIQHYHVHSWVVMPNHVHLLLTPQVEVSRLLRSLKGATAKEANLLLGRTGRPFWQHESYDHLVRDGAEFRRIERYIANNPVAAGLAARIEDYLWSSESGASPWLAPPPGPALP